MPYSHDPSFFFHQPAFIFRDPEVNTISISHQQVTIYFTHREGELVSLERSSFGGPVIQGPTDLTDLVELLKKITKWSLEHKVSQIQIRCFPEAYNPRQIGLINKAFLLQEYKVLYTDIDQLLVVNNNEGIRMSASAKSHIRKCQKLGFEFVRPDHTALEEAYALIAESRQRKNYTMSMNLPDLADMFRKFPENYFLFGVNEGTQLIAAAVVIVISPKIWYCFYLGDDLNYRKYSPITFLIEQLYGYAKERGVTFLDLGTSSDKGVVNPGVYAFKKSLGCEVTYRHTFIQRL